jgi:serine/threonine protein kinase/tetratricopeptide (TPR) repeat protein
MEKQSGSTKRTLNSAGVMEPTVKASSGRVRMGSFELDLRSGELCSLASDGAANKAVLREQPFQVLRMLVEWEGKIVTRSEIKKRLWPNDTIVDHDHIINVAIGVLRRALGDTADSPRYIETLARRGYRLLPPVEWLNSNARAAEVAVTPETSPLADLTGKRVCQYRVLEVLGGGGMGMVYKADDLKLGRRAALKFLPEELAGDPIALQRLEQEAQTASALNHPNICTVYDIENYRGQPFIAMELLEGETLQQHLAASAPNAIPVLSLIDIAMQVCLGLEAARGKDIVHRDIKPANIFLTKQGPVKLLDFGVAKLVANEAVNGVDVVANGGKGFLPSLQPNLTRTGVTVGTTGYMSPEQIRNEELDGRSDLFSLGMVLYEMATGHRAFTGDTAVVVQEAILTKTPPPVESLNPEMPGLLATVIRKALEKDRSQRYQTATAMRHDLERVRGALLQSDRRRMSRWVPGAAAVLAIAGAFAWLSARHTTGVTLSADDTIVIAHLTNATGDRVFDEALYTALRIALEQTPYLNVLADYKVRDTLTGVGVDIGARITPEVALQVCRRTGSRVVVAPAIADAGNRLGLELKAIDCRSGSTIIQIRNEAASRDGVVAALGSAAFQLRREIGEPESSLGSYNASLQDATSSSPDALELLTLGYQRQLAGSSREALPFYQHAVQVDPNFALAQAALSNTASANVDQTALAAAAGLKAFEQRGRMTAPARFKIESTYHREVTGDWEQSCDVLSQWVHAFPHDVAARNNFSECLSVLGQQDRALGEAREAARLLPAAHTYAMWAHYSLLVDRLDDAQTTMDEAIRRGFDSTYLRDLRVRIAFLRKDDVGMQQQWTWGIGRADGPQLFSGKALVEAYHGQFGAAYRSADTATALAAKVGYTADYNSLAMAWMALTRIDVGLPLVGSPAVDSKQTLPSRLLGALLLARAGRREEAMEAAEGLRRDHPSNTIVQKYGLPLIDAAVRLRSSDAAGAVGVLEPVRKYDLALTPFPGLYPSYLRGLAHLQTGDNAAAATEFQKILARPGLVGRLVIGALARLQFARAQRAMGQDSAARDSYEAFLALWHNADNDVPLYREARAEYNALRRGTADRSRP